MPVNVMIEDTGEQYVCRSGESLLASMLRLGRRGIPVGCRGGGCGVCKVVVTKGQVSNQVMSRAHISSKEEAKGYVLACKCQPLSDVSVKVVGHMQKTLCRQRSQANHSKNNR